MLRIAIYFAFILLLAWGIVLLIAIPGSIVLDLPTLFDNNVVEIKPIVVIAAFLGAMVIGILIWSLWRVIRRTPRNISDFFVKRRWTKGYQALSTGLIAASAGDVTTAKIAAVRAQKLLKSEPLTRLLVAQTAQIQGVSDDTTSAYSVLAKDQRTRLVGLRGLYLEAKRANNEPQAKIYLEQALVDEPKLKWANLAMLDYRVADRDWLRALDINKDLTETKVFDQEQSKRYRATLLTAQALKLFSAKTQNDTALKYALEAQRLAPDLIPAAVVGANILALKGKLRRASRLLENSWVALPHPEISKAYANLRAGDAAKDCLERMRTLVSKRPATSESRIALARAAIDAGELTLAREIIEPHAIDNPVRGLCLLMAEIVEIQTGNHARVNAWLIRAENCMPDNIWIADGVISGTWEPLSPVTGKLDAFRWQTPANPHYSSFSGNFLQHMHDTSEHILMADELKRIGTDTSADSPGDKIVKQVAYLNPEHNQEINPNVEETHEPSDRNDEIGREDDHGDSQRGEIKKNPSASPVDGDIAALKSDGEMGVMTKLIRALTPGDSTKQASKQARPSNGSEKDLTPAVSSSEPVQKLQSVDESIEPPVKPYVRDIVEARQTLGGGSDDDLIDGAKIEARAAFSPSAGDNDNGDHTIANKSPVDLRTEEGELPESEKTDKEKEGGLAGFDQSVGVAFNDGSNDGSQESQVEVGQPPNSEQKAGTAPLIDKSAQDKSTQQAASRSTTGSAGRYHLPDDPGVDENTAATGKKWFSRLA